MVFQLLEDLTEMSTIKDCKYIFGYIESKQDVLGKVIVICIHFVYFDDIRYRRCIFIILLMDIVLDF
jgi:hypothetical protein